MLSQYHSLSPDKENISKCIETLIMAMKEKKVVYKSLYLLYYKSVAIGIPLQPPD